MVDADSDELPQFRVLHLGQSSRQHTLRDLLVDLCCVLALRIGVLHGGQLQHTKTKAVHVYLLIVLLLVQLRCHELWCAKNALRSGEATPKRSQAQVTNLNDATGTVHKYVIAFEVTVDDGWIMSVQIHQALQDLPCPAFQHLLINVLVLLAVLAQRAAGEQLSDEVNSEVLVVQPRVKESHDVLVLELLQNADLGEQALPIRRRGHQVVHLDLVPGHLQPILIVKSLVHCLEGSTS
mmetsp:Transcript_3161/g.5419  ORF Transcript_3161/g.5419 Transcript_3161/m.5419 type:complete len:237 (-) Transcript_3161:439-1149(-)